MKMKVMGFKLQAKAETPDEADLNIFDDIGEYEDWWDGELKGFGPKKLTEQLAECSAKTLNVHINSQGGDIYDGIAVHNILKGSDKKINVIVDGMAASAASIIAMSGDTVKMYQASMMMLHNCWTYAMGNSKQLRELADDMDKVMASAKLTYLSKAKDKLAMDKLTELLDAESYLSAQDCLDLGLCDSILDIEEDTEPEEPEEKPKDLGPTFNANAKDKCWFF